MFLLLFNLTALENSVEISFLKLVIWVTILWLKIQFSHTISVYFLFGHPGLTQFGTLWNLLNASTEVSRDIPFFQWLKTLLQLCKDNYEKIVAIFINKCYLCFVSMILWVLVFSPYFFIVIQVLHKGWEIIRKFLPYLIENGYVFVLFLFMLNDKLYILDGIFIFRKWNHTVFSKMWIWFVIRMFILSIIIIKQWFYSLNSHFFSHFFDWNFSPKELTKYHFEEFLFIIVK